MRLPAHACAWRSSSTCSRHSSMSAHRQRGSRGAQRRLVATVLGADCALREGTHMLLEERSAVQRRHAQTAGHLC